MFLSICLHVLANIVSTNERILENWREMLEGISQTFGNWQVTLNITKESIIFDLLRDLVFRQRFAIWKVSLHPFSDILFFFNSFPPKTFPNFHHFESFSEDILVSLRIIGFTLFPTFPNFDTYFLLFLTITTMIKAPHSFKDRLTMSTESVDAEVFDFVLFSGSIDTFSCTLRPSILEMIHHHVLKSSSTILERFEFAQLSISFPSSVQPSGHFLSQGERIELTSVYSYDGSTQIICESNFSFAHYCFTCENNRRSSHHIKPDFLQKIFIVSSEWVKLCCCWRV